MDDSRKETRPRFALARCRRDACAPSGAWKARKMRHRWNRAHVSGRTESLDQVKETFSISTEELSMRSISRRRFLSTTAVITGAAAVGAAGESSNEKVGVAVLGCGRGRALAQ